MALTQPIYTRKESDRKHIAMFSAVWCMVAAALMMVACSTDNLPTDKDAENSNAICLWADIDEVPVTRVNDEGFADGDRIGVYVVDYRGDLPGTLLPSGNHADNVRHTYEADYGRWTASTTILWKDKHTHVDIYGYYPYGQPQSVTEYPFAVKANQNSMPEGSGMGGYEASDFLWAKAADIAPTTSRIHLAMHHRMACAKVTLVRGEGFTAQEWAGLEKSVQMVNLVRQAKIDLGTGTVTAKGEVEKTATTPLRNGDEWRAIVVPQTLKGGTNMFDITLDGTPYRFARQEDFTYQPGHMSNFSIKVDRKIPEGTYTLSLTGESITAWENDPVSHNGNTKEYIVVPSSMEHLHDSVEARGIDGEQVVSLKLTGEVTSMDLSYIRLTMPNLKNLNLKEVTIRNNEMTTDFQGCRTLAHIILPDNLKTIQTGAFQSCTNLSGSISIPEGVTRIGWDAFYGCQALTGSLTLPSTLEEIGMEAFEGCNFSCELQLPEGLKRIGNRAFYGNTNLYGTLVLPESLAEMGYLAFGKCKKLTGSLTIPHGIKEVGEGTFYGCTGMNGTLTLHDGIATIEENAFNGTQFKGELILPKNMTVVQQSAFQGNLFSHIVFPEGLESIGASAFEADSKLAGELELPVSLEYIGDNAFNGCNDIEALVLPKNLDYMGDRAFGGCSQIGRIVCNADIPPTISEQTFTGVPKNNFAVEVPEAVVTEYQTAHGWDEFARITAYRELVCTPSAVCALNAEQKQSLTLDAEGTWSVESKPSWCRLSQISGKGKTELTLTISAQSHGAGSRTGEVVFLLDDMDYTCTLTVTQQDYEHERDQWITMQKATQGNKGGIDIVLLGDGFDAKDIADGSYMQTMEQQVERFFGIEPYKTYRPYFNVYTAIALSQESGIGTDDKVKDNRFETTYGSAAGLTGNTDEIFAYALKAPTVNTSNLGQTLIIMVPNTTEYGGNTQMWADGSAISFCPLSLEAKPYDSRGIIQHEAGGHGFGKLGDECIRHNTFISQCQCGCCQHESELQMGKALGWYDNLSLTGKTNAVPWSQMINDPKYDMVVDIFEGGFMHARGVFRPEQNSCMNNNIPYYNAISRMSIVKRIKRYAGETFSYEDFKAHDVLDASTATRSAGTACTTAAHHHAPVIHQGCPLKKIRKR